MVTPCGVCKTANRKSGLVDEGSSFAKPMEDWEVEEDIKIQQKNFEYIMEIVLKSIKDKNNITLEEFIHFIRENKQEEILNYRFFTIFGYYSTTVHLSKYRYRKIKISY